MPNPRLIVTEHEMRIWRLRHISGWSQRRIARHLRISPPAVSQALKRIAVRQQIHPTSLKPIIIRYIRLSNLSQHLNV